jgi:hypothetical protein
MATTSTDKGGRNDTGLREATGQGRDAWYAELDAWGAAGKPYLEIAAWLAERGMSDWWAQKTIVEYEQARGVRGAGARRDGTFTAGASKSIDVAPSRVLDAFTEAGLRARWLSGYELIERSSTPGKRVRFDVADGTRLSVTADPKGATGTALFVEQERIADAETAATKRALLVERLAALKDLLER